MKLTLSVTASPASAFSSGPKGVTITQLILKLVCFWNKQCAIKLKADNASAVHPTCKQQICTFGQAQCHSNKIVMSVTIVAPFEPDTVVFKPISLSLVLSVLKRGIILLPIAIMIFIFLIRITATNTENTIKKNDRTIDSDFIEICTNATQC